MNDFFGDFRNESNSAGTRTDNTHALAKEPHRGFGLLASVVPLGGVIVEPLNIGYLRRRQDTNSRDEESRLNLVAILGPNLPAIIAFSVDRRCDRGIEMDVFA